MVLKQNISVSNSETSWLLKNSVMYEMDIIAPIVKNGMLSSDYRYPCLDCSWQNFLIFFLLKAEIFLPWSLV